MAFSSETVGRLVASGRNYASVLVGFIGGVGVISASQQKGFTDALNEIFNGLSQVVHGATSLWQILIVAFPVIGVLMAKLASNSAKTTNQATAVQVAVKESNNNNPTTQLSTEVKAKIIDAAASIPEVKANNLEIKVGDPVLANAVTSSKVVA